jgi:hypothetical protein
MLTVVLSGRMALTLRATEPPYEPCPSPEAGCQRDRGGSRARARGGREGGFSRRWRPYRTPTGAHRLENEWHSVLVRRRQAARNLTAMTASPATSQVNTTRMIAKGFEAFA